MKTNELSLQLKKLEKSSRTQEKKEWNYKDTVRNRNREQNVIYETLWICYLKDKQERYLCKHRSGKSQNGTKEIENLNKSINIKEIKMAIK